MNWSRLKARAKAWLFEILQWAFRWGDRHVPPGLRILVGIPLIIGGLLGFLPILGFWMAPLGAVLIALDVPPWRRWLRRKLDIEDTG